MLFKVEQGKDVFDLNPQLKAVEEFSRLTDRQMVYVILATDYRSPFRKLSLEEKKTQAATTAGYKYEKDGKRLDMNARNLIAGKVGAVEAAIKRYRELQRDEDYETLLSVSTLISQIRDLNNKPAKSTQDLEKAVKMTKDLATLTKIKKELEHILEVREDEAIDPSLAQDTEEPSKDSASLSVLAKLNMNAL